MLLGTSLAVQWLRLCTSTKGGKDMIPGQETKNLHAAVQGAYTLPSPWPKKIYIILLDCRPEPLPPSQQAFTDLHWSTLTCYIPYQILERQRNTCI